jgi:hypothetical protein
MITRGESGVVTAFTAVAADQSIGDIAVTTGAPCEGYRYAAVEVALGNADNQWTVTPLFLNAARDAWLYGEPITISGADGQRQSLDLLVQSAQKVAFLCNGSSGTTPTITIKVRPYSGG